MIDNAVARDQWKRAQRFDAAIGQFIGRQDADDAAVMRVVARLNARPLPRQKVPLWRLPAMLLDFQLTPAWPRVAALCACVVIGFFVGMLPAARIGDKAICIGPIDTIVTGEFTVLIGNRPASRVTDPHLCPPIHYGGPMY